MSFFLIPNGRQAALLVALTALLSGNALAEPLTEAEALRLGLSRPELIELARARIGEAQADLTETAVWANPTFEVARDRTGGTNETSWQVSQPFDFSGRRSLREKAAGHRRTAAEAGNRALYAEQAAGLRKAFYAVLRQQETLRALQAWAARFGDIGIVVKKLANAGEASGYDRRRLMREQRAAEARLAEADAELARNRAILAALLGQGADDGVSGRLLPDSPDDLAVLKARLAERPDLVALAAKVEAAEAEHAAARRNFPEVTLGIGSTRVDDGFTRETGTLFSVEIPLPIFDRQQAGNRRTAAQAMSARAELGLARQAAEGELLGLHGQLLQLRVAAERYRREAVGPSAELVRIAEAAYRAGESTVLELLDAYGGALEAETMALDLEWRAREARIELDQMTGTHSQ